MPLEQPVYKIVYGPPDAAASVAASLAADRAEDARDAALSVLPPVEFASVADLRAATGLISGRSVALQGYYAAGDGGGGDLWVDGTDTTGADNGGTCFVTADSKRVKRASLNGLNPLHFGARTGGAVECGARLQAFMTFAASTDCGSVNWSGRYLSARQLVWDGSATKKVIGNLTVVTQGTFVTALRLLNADWVQFDGAFIDASAAGTAYADRTIHNGLVVENSSRCKVDFVRVTGVRGFGVDVIGTAPGNSNASMFGHISARYCGTADTTLQSGAHVLTRVCSARSRTGSSQSSDQREVLTLTGGTPADVANYCRFVQIDGRTHQVTAAGENTITVYPWVRTSLSTGFSVMFHVGGGLKVAGNDGNVINVNTLDVLGVGVGYDAAALHPGLIGEMTSQFAGVDVAIGLSPSSACEGGAIGNLYCEDASETSILIVTGAEATSFEFGDARPLTTSKMWRLAAADVDGAVDPSLQRWAGVGLLINGTRYEASLATKGASSVKAVRPGPFGHSVISDFSNNQTYTLEPPLNLGNAYQYNLVQIVVAGTGANNKPATAVTLTPTSGYSIDGLSPGTSKVINQSSLTGGAIIYAVLHGTNWKTVITTGIVL